MSEEQIRPIPMSPQGRLVSLDALRGFDMFWITGGDAIMHALPILSGNLLFQFLGSQFDHSSWNGFTFYDLIFPLFLYIVGVAMPFSTGKRLERGDSKKELYKHVVKRTAVLFFFGLIYNGLLGLNFETMRYAGVLQRIALCYFFASIIMLNFGIRGQAIWMGAILIFYWLVMTLVPVPGHSAGVLTPEGNLSSYIDQHLLPGRFCCFKFGDNEGILSTIPAVATTLLGVLSGHWMKRNVPPMEKLKGLIVGGIISLILSLIINTWFPINKLIWTSSYVLFAGGWSMLLFALFFYIIDMKGYKKWAFFFIVIGMNPITIYVLQSQFNFGSIPHIFVRGFIDHLGDFKPLFWALCVAATKWLFLYILYKKKIFIKI